MEVQVRDDLGTVLRAKLTFEVVQTHIRSGSKAAGSTPLKAPGRSF
jgi:hypothetical protein